LGIFEAFLQVHFAHPFSIHFPAISCLRPGESPFLGSFLVANWVIGNLVYANFFLEPRGPDGTNRWHGYGDLMIASRV
jgi:hypothetical protein